MSSYSYLTLEKEGSQEIVINKSRFIGYGAPVKSEDEALDFLRRIRAKHKDASHNCYGYIIGENAGIIRYSDDGEPSGTAGMPIVEVLKNKGLVNCAVVVTRYFGGVLLGAGGLVRAYTQGSVLACEASHIVMMESTEKYICEVSYSLWDKVAYVLRQLPVKLDSSEFTSSVSFSYLVREKDAEAVLKKLTSVTDGKVFSMFEDKMYYPWEP